MRSTTVRRRVALALTAFKAGVIGSVLAVTFGAGIGTSAAPRTGPSTVTMDTYTQVVQAAMTEHDCSTTGFDPGVQPASALVRTPRGALQVVSFDHGWKVFTGERPGLLVAVCLDEDPVR